VFCDLFYAFFLPFFFWSFDRCDVSTQLLHVVATKREATTALLARKLQVRNIYSYVVHENVFFMPVHVYGFPKIFWTIK
jgi:hypothetical protein